MVFQQENSTAVKVRLSPPQGAALQELLERVINDFRGEIDVSHLESAHEKLGDAKAIAIWLRENLELELDRLELVMVLQALETFLDEEEDWPEQLRSTLAETRDQLQSAAGVQASEGVLHPVGCGYSPCH